MTSEAAEKRPRVLLVARTIVLNSDNKILLIKRAEGDRWAAGFWEIPGGKLDEGRDLSHASEDEVLEETGLIVMPNSKLAYVESETVSSGKYAGLPYVLIVGVAKLAGGKMRLSDEHNDSTWASYDEALTYNLKHDVKRALIALENQLNII